METNQAATTSTETTPMIMSERTRIFQENLHSVMEGFRPLMEQNMSNFLHQNTSTTTASARTEDTASNDSSVVINVGEANTNEAHSPEARQILESIKKCAPFVLILGLKTMYDHREGILHFLLLGMCFFHANSVIKREASKQARKSFQALLLTTVYISACFALIGYVSDNQDLFSNLIFVPSYSQPLNFSQLMWIVVNVDFMIKMICICTKIALICLPAKIIAYEKRGKLFLLIESTFQLYRSLTPIEPWLYFLLEAYQGGEKVVGVLLAAGYMAVKGNDLLHKGRLFQRAVVKSFRDVPVGVPPADPQLSGDCAICQEVFQSPLQLPCQHIFCSGCVAKWLDRQRTCPLCRKEVAEEPLWRDGSTSAAIILF